MHDLSTRPAWWTRLLIAAVTLTLCLGLTACSDDEGSDEGGDDATDSSDGDVTDGSDGDVTDGSDGDVTDGSDSDGDVTDGDDGDVGPPNPDCDPLDPAACSLPWPSSLYLEQDAERATGYTLRFGATSLPTNRQGVAIDPAPYARMDGYSLGSPLLVVFPELDVSGMATEYDIAPSVADDAPVVWLEVDDAGQVVGRVPYWVELDGFATDPARQLLFVRPAVILEEGTRYVVAFRGLSDTSGAPIPRSEAFEALASGATDDWPALAGRQARFDEVFAILEGEGIARGDVTLAWDFVTASSDALHGSMLHMIDDAMATVGDEGPPLTITNIEDLTQDPDEALAYRVEGTFEVPHYMQPSPVGPSEAWTFNLGADGLPAQRGTREARFWVGVPKSALDQDPNGLVLYGHGLLGSGRRAWASFNNRIADQHNLMFFGADLVGMSENDEGAIVGALQDMSQFPILADRLHQGMLEYVLLTRAMRRRFTAAPEIAGLGLALDTDEAYYSGISQGGIFGTTFMALSPDVQRGHLGVPGNNYSTLLHRSVDFEPFFQLLRYFYPDTVDQAILLSTIQLLWDGTDPVSYARHVKAEPFTADRAGKDVLYAPARGDWQVSVMTNEVIARTDIGVPLLENYDVDRPRPWGAPVATYPHVGSGVVLYNFGNPWPEAGNHPPVFEDLDGDRACDEGAGEVCDPHEKPRRRAPHNEQMVHFFRTGEIIDVCGGAPCVLE